jgi:hypothetical protein
VIDWLHEKNSNNNKLPLFFYLMRIKKFKNFFGVPQSFIWYFAWQSNLCDKTELLFWFNNMMATNHFKAQGCKTVK